MTEGVDNKRRNLILATTGVTAVGMGFLVTPFIGSWQPSAKAKAAGAPVKVNISKIEPGQNITAEWRGKPVFILRRTPEVLETIASLDGVMADPDSERESQQPSYAKNQYRSIKSELSVLLGLCTHLGCSPKFRPEMGSIDADWRGGYYCPCHGSKFDLAGRVYKNFPAPSNLKVPPHRYESDDVIVIGEDQEEVLS